MLPRFLFTNALLLTAVFAASGARADEAPPVAPSGPAAEAPKTDATLLIELDETDAHVLLDGRPLEASKVRGAHTVAPGHHVVEARKEGWPPQRKEIDVGAGETSGVVLRVVPLSTEAIGFDVPTSGPQAETHNDSYRLPLLLTGAALAVGGLALGVGMNLAANAKADDALTAQAAITHAGGTTSSCRSPSAAMTPACGALQDSITARNVDANVSVAGYVAGGAIAAATVTYLIWPALAPVFTPEERHHSWVGSVRPTPIVAPTGGGLVLAGSF